MKKKKKKKMIQQSTRSRFTILTVLNLFFDKNEKVKIHFLDNCKTSNVSLKILKKFLDLLFTTTS